MEYFDGEGSAGRLRGRSSAFGMGGWLGSIGVVGSGALRCPNEPLREAMSQADTTRWETISVGCAHRVCSGSITHRVGVCIEWGDERVENIA